MALYAQLQDLSLQVVAQASAVLCAVTVLVSVGEFSRLRDLTGAGGLLDKRVHGRGVLRAPGGFPAVIAVQGFCSAVLLAAGWSGAMVVVALSALALFVVSAVLGVSLPWGRDGADEMALIGTAGTGMIAAGLAGGDHQVAVIGSWFLASVLCISYFASGAAKLGGPAWRDGSALSLVMHTHSYGHAQVARVIDRFHWLGVTGSYLMMIGEIAFPIALVTPEPVSLVVLVCGAGFHLLTAIMVRLNRFVPAFLASYPAMLWIVVHR